MQKGLTLSVIIALGGLEPYANKRVFVTHAVVWLPFSVRQR